MNIIDSHIHFWDLSNNFNSWVYKTENIKLRQNYLPDHLSIKNFVHIEAHDSNINTIKEINWLEKEFSNVNIRYIAFLDFFNDVEKITSLLHDIDNIVGYRQILSYHHKATYSPLTEPKLPNDFLTKLTLLQEKNKIFECQMYPDQILKSIDMLNKSNVKTAIEHCGIPYFGSQKDINLWKKMIAEISDNANIILKLSGLDMLGLTKNQKIFCLEYIQEFIPSNRLCYGSNYPVCHTDDYYSWYNLLHQFFDAIYHQDIFYQTAFNTYWQ